jgi:hypothetical protein
MSDNVYSASFQALFVLFILATILESGLAVIFNWRPFLLFFDARGVKTVVTVAFALTFVKLLDLDVVASLLKAYDQQHTYFSTWPSQILTALVLGGGSSGVNKLMVALGFRSVKTAEQVTPKPPKTEAWIAVALDRLKARGPVQVVLIHDTNSFVIGTISGSANKNFFSRLFLRDFGRFPTAGGHSVRLATEYKIQLRGFDEATNPIESAVLGPFMFDPGAIVDFEIRL